mmetsp:Transcript_96117/g.269037  ORF Transcript_96117/g.269037 Transcript_96117/m.269037 type:complete len:768 (-) Transcript_96117:89-2392(-)
MKLGCVALLFSAFFAASCEVAQRQSEGHRTITQVVKLLQDLLGQSKQEGDLERELYAKFKCYCDQNEAGKTGEIASLTREIAILSSDIEELSASSGKLSRQVAKLDKDMAANRATQDKATSIHEKEHREYSEMRGDSEMAIEQLHQAIQTLSDIGADQTMAAAADHRRYMAGHQGQSLVKLQSTVKAALLAADAFVSKKQAMVVDAFLQAPFTGTHTAQSGEVVGILKDMLDTFVKNLDGATSQEQASEAAYHKLMGELLKAFDEMDAAYVKKQGELAANDGGLASRRQQLDISTAMKAEAEDFLAKLGDACATKAKQYDERVKLRTSEQAALAQAISILNSDAAFDTFGTSDATHGAAALLQTQRAEHRAVRRHRANFAVAEEAPGFEAAPRKAAKEFLQKAAKTQGSSTLGRIADMFKTNPFEIILTEIDKVIALLAEEGDKDQKQHDWCMEVRDKTHGSIYEKDADISNLNVDIQMLTVDIEDPQVGLKALIRQSEDILQHNSQSQMSETAQRKKENGAYQKDISNLVQAQALLQRAVVILRKFYSKIDAQIAKAGASLVQSAKGKRDDPAPPGTWEDKYHGQSGGGVTAIDMLEYILQDTKAEEAQAHEDERLAQHMYEDSMAGLKQEEADTQDGLAADRKLLTEKEGSLLEKQRELVDAQNELKALEKYLDEIRPGCDFIMQNIDLRMSHRENERMALETSVTMIKESPGYEAQMAKEHTTALGECVDVCKAKTEEHVECKACLAHTSVPGYCAGHAGVMGC